MSLLFFTLRADQLLAHRDVEPNPGPEDPLSRGALASKSNCSHIEDDAGRRHCRPDSNMSLTSHLNPLATPWHPRPQLHSFGSGAAPAPRPTPARPSALLVSNVRSLLPKISELRQLVASSPGNPPDLIAITERWLTPCVPDSAVCLPGYCLYCRDRKDGRQGGGVAVFSRDKSRCKPRPDLQRWCEDLWLEFPSNQSAKARSLILGCYYRPPSSDLSAFLSALESSVSLTDYTRQDVLLVGDFNATSPSWLCTDSYNPAGSLL